MSKLIEQRIGNVALVVENYDDAIEFTEEPRTEEYGTVVVFKDLYGTKWDLLQLTK